MLIVFLCKGSKLSQNQSLCQESYEKDRSVPLILTNRSATLTTTLMTRIEGAILIAPPPSRQLATGWKNTSSIPWGHRLF
ncbi:hypothetical protein CEXT_492491 [Caerostris extrusa]|uniref:Uncharacterized protein n=1 Tax=Caerostris extrusa TaxID=172846 RepID=A0AAV4X7Y9_CAEEX|nr:hypothetical protein CEXT_492491 [Caerostris extrusa]